MDTLLKMAGYLGLGSWGDPTARFPPLSAELTPAYDFEARALNGIPYSSPAAALMPFGPASRVVRFGDPGDITLHYAPLGLAVTLDAQGVVSFDFSFEPEKKRSGKEHRTELVLLTGSRVLGRLDRGASCSRIDALLGPPSDRAVMKNSGELASDYVVSGTYVATFHSPDGTGLRYLALGESA